MHVFYLHGFASSPGSGKAQHLRAGLARYGLTLHAPDFNAPDFSTLTVTRMLGQVDREIATLPPGPVALVGSSLGGFVAMLAAARRVAAPDDGHPITHLVLLAPAIDFASGRDDRMSAQELEEWRRTNRRDFFHYAWGRTLPMHFGLYEDAHGYDARAVRVDVPILLFQGTRDQVVNPQGAIDYASSHPNVILRMVDDEHQLQGHLGLIWAESVRFLGLAGRR